MSAEVCPACRGSGDQAYTDAQGDTYSEDCSTCKGLGQVRYTRMLVKPMAFNHADALDKAAAAFEAALRKAGMA